MGRRRRRAVRIPKKRLPKFFSCPYCGKETVRVELFRDEAQAVVSCSSCGAKEEFRTKPVQCEIDIYCMFTDMVHRGSRRSSTMETEGAT